ncbi:MAG: hypothetical protein V4493_01310 [Pseudomonadota bacterium]
MDQSKELNGVPIQFEANDDGTVPTFIIARMGETNKPYMKAIELAQKPYMRQIQLKTMNKELHEKIIREVFATTIIKDWSNIQDENGNGLVYSKDNAVKILTDLPELYTQLFNFAMSADAFKKEELEESAKN